MGYYKGHEVGDKGKGAQDDSQNDIYSPIVLFPLTHRSLPGKDYALEQIENINYTAEDRKH